MRNVFNKAVKGNLPKHAQPVSVDLRILNKEIFIQRVPSLNAKSPKLIILEIDPNLNLHKVIQSYADQNVMIALWISNKEIKQLPDLFKMNIQGYFLKGMSAGELQVAITSMLNGLQYVHPKLVPILLQSHKNIRTEQRPKKLLSQREWEILEQIVHGKNTETISEHLNIARKTVKNHIGNILKKLNVDDRTSAAVLAIKNQWVIL